MEEISSNIQQNLSNSEVTEKTSVEASEGINAVAERAVQAIEANKSIMEKIKIINDITFQTNILMSTTIPKVKNTTHLIQEITSASKGQSNGVEQVNKSIQLLNNVT